MQSAEFGHICGSTFYYRLYSNQDWIHYSEGHIGKRKNRNKLSSAEIQVENYVNKDNSPSTKEKKLGSWLKRARQDQESVVHSPEQVVRDEAEQCCKIVKPDTDSKINPLQWWQ